MKVQIGNSSSSVMQKGCSVLFFSIFAGVGTLLLFLIGTPLKNDLRSHDWVPVPAVLLGSVQELESSGVYKVESKDEDRVPFRYTYEGKTYTRDTVTLPGTMKINGRTSESGARLKVMPAGTEVTCFVNPENPSEAVLEKRSLGHAFFLIVPGVFMLVGFGGIFLTLRSKPENKKPVSRRHTVPDAAKGSGILRGLGFLFLLVGVVATWFVAVKPALKARSAREWLEVPCKIVTAEVGSHKGGKGGRTYSIRLIYTYEVDGRKYAGDRYNFSTGSSSSRDWREKAVSELRANPSPVCLVNPEAPEESVIVPEVGGDMWFGIIPLVFAVVGFFLFTAASKLSGKRNAKTGIPLPATKTEVVSLAGGGVELKAGSSPKAGCIGLGFGAVFWNSIVLAIFFQADTPLPVRLFLSIFLLIGIGLLCGWGYYFLSMFNPKPTLIADAQTVELGKTLRLKWRFSGNTARITRFAVLLTAKESATYRRGTDTTTDHLFFVHEQVFETRERTAITSGEVAISIPANSMHSLDASNNKITWAVKLHGDIAKWPDVDFEFPITVLPATAPHFQQEKPQ